MPSLRSSPWILGAPHRGLAAAILLTRALIAASTGGRPAGRRPESVAQWRRKRRRCQRRTGAGGPETGGRLPAGPRPRSRSPKRPSPPLSVRAVSAPLVTATVGPEERG